MKALGCALAALLLAALPGPARSANCTRTMNETNPPSAALAALAAQKVLAAMPAGGPYAVLLQLGEGALAGPAGKALRQALACDRRVVFSTVEHRSLPPVADSAAAGGHVDAVADTVQPWPRLVLRVSEAAGTLYIAAREPGNDPLGPPEAGWLWVLQQP